MNDSDIDQLRVLLHPLVRDVEAAPYPRITAATLARWKEARTR